MKLSHIVPTTMLAKITTMFVLINYVFIPQAFAGGLGVETEGAIDGTIKNVTGFLTGPVAKGVVIMALIVCGGMWFMNRQAQNAQTLGRIAIGCVLIFFAEPLFTVIGLGENQTGTCGI